ncbi:MAG: MMPL family transporter [Solirubrobacterales bacterium]
MPKRDSDPIATDRGFAWWLGRTIVLLRFLVIPAWIVGVVIATNQLPSAFGGESAELGSLLPDSSRAIEVEEKAEEEFGFPLISRSMAVLRREGGFGPEAVASGLAYVARIDRADPHLKAVPLVGGAQRAVSGGGIGDTMLVYIYVDPSIGESAVAAKTDEFAARMRGATGAATVRVTGALPASRAEAGIANEHLLWVEIATVLLVVGILALYYRSVGIPLLCLAAVGLAYLLSDRLLGLTAERFDLAIPEEVEPVIVALLFGVLTDYLVFFVSGFRTRLRRGASAREAATNVTGELIPVVSTAVLMIAGATMTLTLAGVEFLSAFGPAMAISVIVAGAVSLTFIPACLALFGRAIFRPARIEAAEQPVESAEDEVPSARGRVVGFAARRPLLVTVVCLGALIAAASGLSRLELGNPIIRGLPDSSSPKQGYNQASAAFGPGVLGPSMLLIEGTGLDRQLGSLGALQEEIEAQPGISAAVGPGQQLGSVPRGVFVAADGSAARFLIVLDADPDGPVAPEILSRLEARLPSLLAQVQGGALRGASFGVTGDTTIGHELTEDTWQAGLRVAPAAIAVLILLLWILLRSWSAPLYLVGSSLLVVAAALGLTVYVFQDLLGYNELAFFVPVATAILMLALGADYNVFLISRIWREAERHHLRKAIRTAGSRASSAITVAGLILALSFAAVALIPIAAFRELAFALFVGLMLDTFLARTLLVPALVSLFGRADSGHPRPDPDPELEQREDRPLRPSLDRP